MDIKPKLKLRSWYKEYHCGVCGDPLGDSIPEGDHCEVVGTNQFHYVTGSLLRDMHEKHDVRHNLIDKYTESFIKKEIAKTRSGLSKAYAKIGDLNSKLRDLRLHCPHDVKYENNINAEREGSCTLCGKAF